MRHAGIQHLNINLFFLKGLLYKSFTDKLITARSCVHKIEQTNMEQLFKGRLNKSLND